MTMTIKKNLFKIIGLLMLLPFMLVQRGGCVFMLYQEELPEEANKM